MINDIIGLGWNWRHIGIGIGRDSDNGITGVREAGHGIVSIAIFVLCMASGDSINERGL